MGKALLVFPVHITLPIFLQITNYNATASLNFTSHAISPKVKIHIISAAVLNTKKRCSIDVQFLDIPNS